MIETLDDIVEEIANKIGVYGACPGEEACRNRPCRCCFTARLTSRIRDAVEVERKLNIPDDPTEARQQDQDGGVR